MPNITKEAAGKFTAELDRVASVLQSRHASLGIPEKVAFDMAKRCDILSDAIDKRYRISRTAQLDPADNFTETSLLPTSFDPADIGEEAAGPPLRNQDEPYMDTFGQEWFDELRTVQQTGQFSNAKSAAKMMQHMARLLHAHQIPIAPKKASAK